jgi:hypothetical protein
MFDFSDYKFYIGSKTGVYVSKSIEGVIDIFQQQSDLTDEEITQAIHSINLVELGKLTYYSFKKFNKKRDTLIVDIGVWKACVLWEDNNYYYEKREGIVWSFGGINHNINISYFKYYPVNNDSVEIKITKGISKMFSKVNKITNKDYYFNLLEEEIGFKLKEDQFFNREILNNLILKISLDNSDNDRGFCLSKNDFIINDNCLDITVYIFNKSHQEEISNGREKEEIFYPEFNLKPKYFNYIEQWRAGYEERQLRRELTPKWDLFQKSKHSYRLPIELNSIIKDILVG